MESQENLKEILESFRNENSFEQILEFILDRVFDIITDPEN